jgi:hypothetical protein
MMQGCLFQKSVQAITFGLTDYVGIFPVFLIPFHENETKAKFFQLHLRYETFNSQLEIIIPLFMLH